MTKVVCPICYSEIHHVGNEDYATDGNKYIYHCLNCGADVEVYEPLDEDKDSYPYWANQKKIKDNEIKDM